ncbi:(2Fe-2S)-binding protein [Pseudohongiella nitratireducens]|uniref:(2Fe-2S)-binding protein n=1 Tax=Pseudohongiella nitratireducens TaxID=1768907 RepID=A0A916QLA0_9GAMM|nr:(2Fe-2S)-binding protein [Pseudohongiella nitratireducens]GFZ75797.1 (2Fe-2S)-binding protein [Pseudohongiella nitratireducens]|tara:strand:+ start:7560 stop:8069 length:510 start_codon:yes stop_codon:yes gene_type:complete
MIELTVNGETRRLDIESDMPLLWALRNELGLTGTKFGCGIAACGACTVQVNGNAMRSCVTPVSAVQGQSITTIEGLSAEGLTDVQQAWIEHQIPQCGYCQSGMIMAVSAHLDNNDSSSADETARAISNICRCGTYPRIKRAIASLQEQRRSGGVQQFDPAATPAQENNV